jgi:hypothetical protein
MTPPPARSGAQRKLDTLNRLQHDDDAWIATAGTAGGAPYLVPLSFDWDGTHLVVATPARSVTSRNLTETGRARVGIGPTRDVVLIEATARALSAAEVNDGVGDAFATRTGFDLRRLTDDYRYFLLRAQRIQAWREANELVGRELMRAGEWLVD